MLVEHRRDILPITWRAFGRNYIQNVPFFTRIPYALIILIILATIAYFIFHRTNYGRQILAVGDNMRASQSFRRQGETDPRDDLRFLQCFCGPRWDHDWWVLVV